MATYPDLPTKRGSDPEPLTKTNIDRAEDGTARGRNYGDDKVKISVEHPYLTAAEKATLDAFYTANRLVPFDYLSPSDGVSRSMLFARAPQYLAGPGNRYTARVEMEQV